MEEFTDKNLVCYFSWGRRKFIEKTFPTLIESIRKQDRLLVLDQQMHNLDYYIQYKDKIDYLIFTKLNYRIGPAWNLFKYFSRWLSENHQNDVEWKPDFINIVESDALIQDTEWINKLMPLFNMKEQKIAIVTGYLGENDPNTRVIYAYGKIMIKENSQGVNIVVRTRDFLKIKDYPNYTQDLHFYNRIIEKGRVACYPCIEHIGIGSQKYRFMK